jgi:CRP/FNR family transcriptional regulator
MQINCDGSDRRILNRMRRAAQQKPPIERLFAGSDPGSGGAGVSCGSCALSQICLPAQLPPEEVRILENAVDRGHVLVPGATLIYAGRPMQALYVVRSGSAKCYGLSAEGEERVRGFYLPGELIGLESFAERRHPCYVVALEPVRYCKIPVNRLELLIDILPGLRREIVRLMSQSLEESQRLRASLGLVDARGRLASFLLDLSRRLERRGLSPREFKLSMSRWDIARYLGLTVETVSRGLTAFKRAGWLTVHLRHIAILRPDAFAALAKSK